MAQLRRNDTVLFFRDALAMRPEIAKRLGILCGEWSRMEQCLAMIFAGFLDASSDEALELDAFERVQTVRNKAAILRSLCELRVKDATLRKRFGDALAKIERLSQERNRYVHGRWAIVSRAKDKIVLTGPMGPRVRTERVLVRPLEFDALHKTMQRENLALWKLFDRVIRPALEPKPD
jgi:hypothetical protein